MMTMTARNDVVTPFLAVIVNQFRVYLGLLKNINLQQQTIQVINNEYRTLCLVGLCLVDLDTSNAFFNTCDVPMSEMNSLLTHYKNTRITDSHLKARFKV